MKNDIMLLDCTLRDGGYVNDWMWGKSAIRAILKLLVKAKVDVVEVGFLRNIKNHTWDSSISKHIEDLNKYLPTNRGNTMFAAMAMQSNYCVDDLSEYTGEGIELIRVTAHNYDIDDGLAFAKKVKEKGYKVAINPINIMGYTDMEILNIINKVNAIMPYQFSIVDTFGSMKRRDLDRIVSLIDNNLDKSIRLGLHLHENMALSSCLMQNFIDKNLHRPISIDGSLMGMGRNPGNLPIEIAADYLNDYCDCNYNLNYLTDAINDFIAPIKGESFWGYSPAYFLSACYNLHRNYSEYLLKRGDLSTSDINKILSRIPTNKKTCYDEKYIEKLYNEYKNNCIDDTQTMRELKRLFKNKDVLLIAPGKSIVDERDSVIAMSRNNNMVSIAVNFIPNEIDIDYVFFSNSKRYVYEENRPYKLIVTSNIKDEYSDFYVDYNKLTLIYKKTCNSLINVLQLLNNLGLKKVFIAGADGYSEDLKNNYCDPAMKSILHRDLSYNMEVADTLRKLDISLEFITKSKYNEYLK